MSACCHGKKNDTVLPQPPNPHYRLHRCRYIHGIVMNVTGFILSQFYVNKEIELTGISEYSSSFGFIFLSGLGLQTC